MQTVATLTAPVSMAALAATISRMIAEHNPSHFRITIGDDARVTIDTNDDWSGVRLSSWRRLELAFYLMPDLMPTILTATLPLLISPELDGPLTLYGYWYPSFQHLIIVDPNTP